MTQELEKRLAYSTKLLSTLPDPDAFKYWQILGNDDKLASWEGLFTMKELMNWQKVVRDDVSFYTYEIKKRMSMAYKKSMSM